MGLVGGIASLFPSNTIVGKLGRGSVPSGQDIKNAVKDVKNTIKTGAVSIGNPEKGLSVNIKDLKSQGLKGLMTMTGGTGVSVPKSPSTGGLSSLNNSALENAALINNMQQSQSLISGATGSVPPMSAPDLDGNVETNSTVKFPIIPVLIAGGLYLFAKSKKLL